MQINTYRYSMSTSMVYNAVLCFDCNVLSKSMTKTFLNKSTETVLNIFCLRVCFVLCIGMNFGIRRIYLKHMTRDDQKYWTKTAWKAIISSFPNYLGVIRTFDEICDKKLDGTGDWISPAGWWLDQPGWHEVFFQQMKFDFEKSLRLTNCLTINVFVDLDVRICKLDSV